MAPLAGIVRIVCMGIVTPVLSGCLPIPVPHKVTSNPMMEGQLTLDGKALSGIRVVVTDEAGQCEAPVATGRTNANGSFSIPMTRTRQYVYFFPLVPLHRIYAITVCVEHNDSWKPVYVSTDYTVAEQGIGPLPKYIYLKCMLDTERLDTQRAGEPYYCDVDARAGWRDDWHR